MGVSVYDYRTDIRNILVTAQIRSRFLRLEPGQVAERHSHDLGHEIFLILEGEAEFEIDGHKKRLGSGQMCVALADQLHSVRAVGDRPMTMYLSVTPHLQPTHTFWTSEGQRQSPKFLPSSAYDVSPDPTLTTGQRIDRHLKAAEALAETVAASVGVQRKQAAKLQQALAEGDRETADSARDTMWEALYPLFQKVYELGEAWNNLSPLANQSHTS